MASHDRNRGDVYPVASKLLEVLLQMYPEYGQEGVEADRECLYCGDTFLSAGAHNRRRPECRQLFSNNPNAFAEPECCTFEGLKSSIREATPLAVDCR